MLQVGAVLSESGERGLLLRFQPVVVEVEASERVADVLAREDGSELMFVAWLDLFSSIKAYASASRPSQPSHVTPLLAHFAPHKDTSTFANNNSKVNNKHGMKTLLLYIPCSTLHRSRSPRCANMVTSKSTCKSWTTVIGGDKDADAVLILAVVWWQRLVCISIFLMHTIFNSIRIRCNGICIM